MRILLRYPTIPEDVLQGALKGQQPPLPTSSLQPGRLQSLGEFWQALGGKPKAALNYQVTAPVDVAAHEEVQLVTDTVVKIRTERGVGS
jgi:Pvc16 N-terminal domain